MRVVEVDHAERELLLEGGLPARSLRPAVAPLSETG